MQHYFPAPENVGVYLESRVLTSQEREKGKENILALAVVHWRYHVEELREVIDII